MHARWYFHLGARSLVDDTSVFQCWCFDHEYIILITVKLISLLQRCYVTNIHIWMVAISPSKCSTQCRSEGSDMQHRCWFSGCLVHLTLAFESFIDHAHITSWQVSSSEHFIAVYSDKYIIVDEPLLSLTTLF